MRRWAWLWISLLLVAVVGATCGAAPRRGYSPVYGDQYGKAKGYAPGQGGAATWDTVTVIFHPGARVDSTATTGKWLFPIPTAYTGADTVKNPRQNHRIWRLNDKILGRGNYPGGGSWRADNADTARVLRLGTGKAVPTFAWANIKQADTNGYYPAQFVINHMERRQIIGGVGYARQTISAVGDSSIIPMFYIPFEDHIPANSTIVSATVNYCSPTATYQGVGDTIISVLMTNASDDEWYKAKGGTGMTNSPNYAHASWLRQTDDNADAWDGDENNAWSPGLTARGYYWSMGNTSDWSGSVMAATSYYYAEQAIPVDITDCVQSAVVGEPNNGIMHIQKSTSTVNRDNTLYGWDAYSTAAKHEPYVAVKYITRRYQKPFGTSDWAFVFQTDDWRAIANKAYADVMQARGGKYTLFGAGNHIGTVGVNDQTRGLSVSEMLAIYDMGNEMGSHSKYHDGAKAIMNRIRAEGTGIGSAAYDSSVVNMSPEWMYVAAEGAGRYLRGAPDYGKSFGAPVSFLTAYSQRALKDLGYDAWRTLSTYSAFDREKYYAIPGPGYTQHADSSMTGATTQYGRHVRNMKEYVPHDWTLRIVGPPDSNSTSPLHLPKVAHNMRRLIEQRRGNDTRVINMFIHDLKSGGSGFYAGEGLNADELDTICAVVNENSGRYMTFAEMGRWFQDGAVAIDYPYANSRPDTFLVDASDRVWFKPDGIDNRWIRGLRNRVVANSFDVTAPPAPASALAYGANGAANLVWPASATAEAVSYRIYRFFDNAADTVMVGTANIPFYQDLTAVNGSPHNYYVTAVDAAGNESAPTATITTTPGTIRALPRPAYWAFWYQDPADHVPLDQDDVQKLAGFDMIVGSPHSLEGPEMNEVGFDGLLGRIRAINPDAIYLTYYTAFCVYDYWADSPPLSVHKRVMNYMESLPDNSGFGRDVAGNIVEGDFYPGQMYNNVMIPSMADTIAKILVETYEGSGTDGEWAGFFLDDSDTTLSNWMCNNYACGDTLDFDQDGTVYNSDADEKAAFKEWHLRLVRAIRREFAERGMQNRLVTANTTWGRKADPSPKDEQYMGLLDGMLNEAWNLYWPGPNIPTNTPKWDLALDWGYQLTHAQTSPPLVMWNARSDSSAQYMNEVLAYANMGLVNANSGSDWSSDSSAPVMGRRKAALTGGTLATAFYDTVAGNATADTLRVVSGNVVARMVMSRAPGDIDNQYAVWPYLITNAAGDTILSRSFYWPLPEDVGPPSTVVQMDGQGSYGGDRFVNLAWGVNVIPGDFRGWYIYRSPCDDCPDNPLLAALPSVTETGTLEYAYVDSAVTNGEEYTYLVAAVDANLNVGSTGESDPLTPDDETAPSVPIGVKAAGGDMYVDLDWVNVSAHDLVGYQINRAMEDETLLSFAVLDTATISAYQDSTALSANVYHYFVRAFDDDGNISAPSDTVFGGWVGQPDPPTYPAPQQVIVRADYPSANRAQVLVIAPSDTTGTGGITGYQIFRSAASDTASAALYRNNIVPDAQFASGIYEDLWANSDPDTTWYYTAKVMYGAGRSEKFHTPRPGLTTGNYPIFEPSIVSVVDGSNILTYWSQLAGSDSTEIYRGMTAGSQTLIATVAHGANPYIDTGTDEDIDYYYKVRFKDNPSTYTAYSDVYGPVSWVGQPSADPSISGVNEGVDNTIQHGEPIVISGTNFGVNDVNGDLWDNMESGSFSSSWSGTGDSSKLAVEDVGAHARTSASTKNAVLRHNSSSGLGNLSWTATSNVWYTRYWVKLDSNWDWGGPGINEIYGAGNYQLSNVKIFDMGSSGIELFKMAFHSGSGPRTNGLNFNNENVTDYDGRNWWVDGYPTGGISKDAWHLFQFEFRRSSAPGVHDGFIRFSIDGAVIEEVGNMMTNEDEDLERTNQIVGFGDTSGSWGYDGANTAYFDDFYLCQSLARVELGNASTYAASTVREIQLPTDWTSTSVSVTANTGSFADGNVYLFVIDEDGTASPGQLVTIDNP